MGLMSFIKEAGEKLFGRQAKAAEASATAAPDVGAANAAAAAAIGTYVAAQGLTAENLEITFDGASGIVTVSGTAPDQATKEKILLCCGNVHGVDQVDDNLAVAVAATPARFHTVVSGDNLSKIAKAFYGNANEYPKIFEANKPMLTHPDKIYPGQVLRIP